MALQGLKNHRLYMGHTLPQELFTGSPQQLGLLHYFHLSYTCHSDRDTLRGFYSLTYWVQGHYLQGDSIKKKKSNINYRLESIIIIPKIGNDLPLF